MPRAIGLFSGGLDSLLAIKLVEAQGIEVIPLTMVTPFFDGRKALSIGPKNGINPHIIDVFDEFLPILKNPPHGYGDQMNPCIDCHILLLKKAKSQMESLGAEFVITGEVLGQRPMSQNRSALNLIERESGLKGLLLRPLSARLLDRTRPELEGLIKRELLLGLSGRSRKPHMELIKRFRIAEYSTPAGGCLLTEPNYALRVKDVLLYSTNPKREEFQLLAIGRHFRLDKDSKLILGRTQRENEVLEKYVAFGDASLRCINSPGPFGLLLGRATEEVLKLSSEILSGYSDTPPDPYYLVEVVARERSYHRIPLGVSKEKFRQFLITPQGH